MSLPSTAGFRLWRKGLVCGGIEPTGRYRLAMDRYAVIAWGERSKNLPLAAGSCYEGKGCGGIEQARRRSRKGFSRPHWEYRKKNCHDRPTLSSL